jgi:methylmalonyl-CoA mutase N-terminal domain/subunit
MQNDSGITIKKVYSADATLSAHPLPGVFPFTRGIQGDMYRGKLWTMRQYAGFSSAEESNKRYKFLLEQGVSGLSVAFDLPTQIGYDSDHPLSEGEVGKVGVAIDSIEDMALLFDGIELDKVSTSMTINATGFILLAMYATIAKRKGIPLSSLTGTIQNDILKEYAARGTYIFPPAPSMRIITDLFEWCNMEMPRWNTISISGYHIREAGSTAAQEVAFTLSNGKAYLRAAIEKGLDINAIGKRLSFFFNAHNNLFEEVAKFRAARKIWAELMQSMGASDPKAMMLRFHTQTGGSTLTQQQPLNNISRVTLQALSAVLGGTQSLHTNGFDEALGLPTEEAAQTALRTQQIIAFESGVADTADPLAGSYYVESLTAEMEEKILAIMDDIEALGGSVRAIEEGYMQEQIATSAYNYQLAIESGKKTVVGLNAFVQTGEKEIPILRIDESIRAQQIQKINTLKQSRDAKRVNEALEMITICASSKMNLMPAVMEAVDCQCTLGEISDTLRQVFGEYRQ